MKLILFGATGMIGAGALREALAAPGVERIVAIGRRSCGITHPKLQELLLPDLYDVASVAPRLADYDACLWGLGVSVVGMDEAAYARVTESLTLDWARSLAALHPPGTFSFCYCSAAGAGGNAMWARVRQRTESALQALPFQHAGVVRPAMIQPGPGIRSGVRAYRLAIAAVRPLMPLLVRTWPAMFTTSEKLGRAMVRVLQGKADRFILESADINRIGAPRDA